jgi:hypothetical protein
MGQITPLVTLAALVGCSDYELHNTNPTDYSDFDTGISDAAETPPLESYDPCDSYGAGWDLPPVGTERSDCVGIEGYAQPYAGMLMTQISFGDCTTKGQPYTRVYDSNGEQYTTNAVMIGGGSSWYCHGDFYVLGWADYSGDNENALANLSLEAKVWLLNEQERDSLSEAFVSGQDEEAVLYTIHEPLTYALECDSNAVSLDEDCTAFLY